MSTLLTWWLPAAALCAGVVLLWIGRRGRRLDDHPLCRKCGRDLFGLPALHERCPECGSQVAIAGVRIGNRQRWPYMAGLGATLLLPSLLWTGGMSAILWAGSDFDQYKPVWLLALEMEGEGAPSAAAELMRRLEASELDRETELELIDRFLDHQADADRPWVALKGDFLELAQRRGVLDWPRWERYVRNGAEQALRTRSVITAVSRLTVEIDSAKLRFGGSGAPLAGGMPYFGGIMVRLAVYPADASEKGAVARENPEAMSATFAPLQSVMPGVQLYQLPIPAIPSETGSELQAVLTIEPVPESWREIAAFRVLAQESDGVFQIAGPDVPEPQWSPTVGLPLTVVEDRSRSVLVDKSPEVISAAAESVADASMHVEFPDWWKLVLIQKREASYDPPEALVTLRLTLRPPQEAPGACYRVLLDDGRGKHDFGVARWRPGDQAVTATGRLPPEFDSARTDQVRLILRPDPAAAEKEIDVYAIRGGEVVVEDVPVKYTEWFYEHRGRLAESQASTGTDSR